MQPDIIIEEVFRRSAQGVLRPFLCRGSDRETYFVKGRGAGPRDLMAEYICARLGTLLGLPIPAFSVVDVPGELVSQSAVDGIWELGGGPAFGSMRVEFTQELAPSTLAKVPTELQCRVLLFDWWVRNEDRHYTDRGGNPNLLWNFEAGELVVFDHNMAFDREFSVERFRSTHAFCRHLPMFDDPSFQAGEGTRLAEAASHLETIFSEMPEVWREGSGNFDIDAVRRILNRHRSPEFWRLQP